MGQEKTGPSPKPSVSHWDQPVQVSAMLVKQRHIFLPPMLIAPDIWRDVAPPETTLSIHKWQPLIQLYSTKL